MDTWGHLLHTGLARIFRNEKLILRREEAGCFITVLSLLFFSAMGGPLGLCPNALVQNGSSSTRKDSWTEREQACISRQMLEPACSRGDSMRTLVLVYVTSLWDLAAEEYLPLSPDPRSMVLRKASCYKEIHT